MSCWTTVHTVFERRRHETNAGQTQLNDSSVEGRPQGHRPALVTPPTELWSPPMTELILDPFDLYRHLFFSRLTEDQQRSDVTSCCIITQSGPRCQTDGLTFDPRMTVLKVGVRGPTVTHDTPNGGLE